MGDIWMVKTKDKCISVWQNKAHRGTKTGSMQVVGMILVFG